MDCEQLLDEWFGPVSGWSDFHPAKAARWWKADAEFDSYLREHYGDHVERALTGQLGDWQATPRGALAGVLLLDQLTRNIYRKTPRMYAGDEQARQWSEHATQQRFDEQLPLCQRLFVYMPWMHSERLSDQLECVRHMQQLTRAAQCLPETNPLRRAVESSLDYAHAHRDIVQRFGRFPHRNAILGRASTPEELEFLKQPGSSF